VTGAHVAVGLDNGKIVVFESDKIEQTRFFDPNKHSQVPPKGGVMNLSYSACGTRIVVVKDSGLAFIWDMSAAGKKKTNKASPVTPIESPTPGGMFRGCYSYSLSKDTSKISFCLGVNVKGKSFLTTWSMDKHSKGKGNSKVLLTRKVAAHQSALTALAGYSTPVRKGATSTEGEKHLVATACSEGEIAVYSLEHGLTCFVRVPNAHMIFVTNLAFSNDGKRVVSVSADAGARITSIVRSGDQVVRARQLRYALLFLLLAMIIYYFLLNNHS
jgi:WD40 repeat protein